MKNFYHTRSYRKTITKKFKPLQCIASIIALFCLALPAKLTAQEVTLHYQSAPIQTVINAVSKQSGFNFLYDAEFLKKAKPVTVNVDKANIGKALQLIFNNQPFTYQVTDKSIVIRDKKANNNAAPADDIIHGMITDSTGLALPGVSIYLKNTAVTAQTDGSGHFYLRSPSIENTIVIRYMGYKTRELNTNGDASLNIVLSPLAFGLDNVVVTGYQTILKDRSTAAVGQVNETKLNAFLNTDLSTALEGKVAGLSLYRGAPVIRGLSTFSNEIGNTPLLVIDGLITEGVLEDINPYDVESVTVLKDAAASSIYGARAANGVIVVSTKKGKKGKTQISFNTDFFITEKPNVDDMHYASTSDQIDYETAIYQNELKRYASPAELFKYYGGIGVSSPRYYSPLYGLFRNQYEGKITTAQMNSTLDQWRNNDYIKQYTDQVWQNESRQRYNLSLSSAGDKSNTYFSLNYDKGNAQVRNNTSERINMYMKSTFNVTDRLTATFGINAAYNRAVATADGFDDYLLQPRYSSIIDADGNRVQSDYVTMQGATQLNSAVASTLAGNTNFKSLKFNILDELDKDLTKTNTLNVRAFTNLDFKIAKGLKYSLMMQYELSKSDRKIYTETDAYSMRYLYNIMTSYNSTTGVYTHNVPEGGRLSQLNSERNNYTIRNQIDYSTSFDIGKTRNDLVVLGGFETRQSQLPITTNDIRYGYNPVNLSSQLLDLNSLNANGITSYQTGGTLYLSTPTTQIETKHRYVSAYANMSYTVNNLYNLTGSIRIDQADLFGTDPKYQYRPLWSVGAGWNATNEDFLSGSSWLDYLKVRATYGVNGNADQTSSPLLTARLTADRLYPNLTYVNVTDLPNPKLRWEKTATTNLGTDFTLLKNRLNGSIDLYYKYSSDLFVSSVLDPTVGTTSQVINNGSLSNKGIEFNLSSNWFQRGGWVLSSSLALAFNKNKVEKVERGSTLAGSYVGSPEDYFYANTIYNSLYAYQYAGIVNGYPTIYDQNGAANIAFDANGNPTTISQVNSPAALVRMGTLTPVYNGSFQQRVKYKNLELGAMFVFYGGNKLRKDKLDFASTTVQTSQQIVNRWTAENPNSGFTRMIFDYPDNLQSYASYLSTYYRYADVNVASATYVKLRNISLSYTLPAAALKKLKVQQVKLTAQVNNPFLWSAVGDDIDPETYSLNSGTRNLSTPASYLMGLAVTF